MLVKIRELIRLATFVCYNKSRPLFRVDAPTQLSFSRVTTSVACARVPLSPSCIAAGTAPPWALVWDPRFPLVSPPRCRSGQARRRQHRRRTQSDRMQERRPLSSNQSMKTPGLHKVRFSDLCFSYLGNVAMEVATRLNEHAEVARKYKLDSVIKISNYIRI